MTRADPHGNKKPTTHDDPRGMETIRAPAKIKKGVYLVPPRHSSNQAPTCGDGMSNKNCPTNQRGPRGKNKSKFVWMMLSGSKHRGLSRTYTTKICLSRLLRISPCQDVDITQHVPLQRVDGNVRHEAEAFYICSCSLGTEEKHRMSAWILA